MTGSRADLRALLRGRRGSLGGAVRFAAARAVAEHLERIPAFASAKRVAGYWAVGGELPLSAVVASIDRDSGRAFYLPKLAEAAEASLRFERWSVGDPIEPNRFGIPEPIGGESVEARALDVVLLPLVGFDREGHRLGTGGGYYDRTFAFRQHSAAPPVLVGVAFASQELEAIDTAAWDVDLDWVVTEHEAIECARANDGAGPLE